MFVFGQTHGGQFRKKSKLKAATLSLSLIMAARTGDHKLLTFRVPSQTKHSDEDESVNFIVDGFGLASPAYSHYFLTHFHADHYGGLNKSFNFGDVYCSNLTARLVPFLGVQKQFIVSKSLRSQFNVQGVQCTFIPANHCPGAVMILFETSFNNVRSSILV